MQQRGKYGPSQIWASSVSPAQCSACERLSAEELPPLPLPLLLLLMLMLMRLLPGAQNRSPHLLLLLRLSLPLQLRIQLQLQLQLGLPPPLSAKPRASCPAPGELNHYYYCSDDDHHHHDGGRVVMTPPIGSCNRLLLFAHWPLRRRRRRRRLAGRPTASAVITGCLCPPQARTRRPACVRLGGKIWLMLYTCPLSCQPGAGCFEYMRAAAAAAAAASARLEAPARSAGSQTDAFCSCARPAGLVCALARSAGAAKPAGPPDIDRPP